MTGKVIIRLIVRLTLKVPRMVRNAFAVEVVGTAKWIGPGFLIVAMTTRISNIAVWDSVWC